MVATLASLLMLGSTVTLTSVSGRPAEGFFNPVAQDKFVHMVSAGYVMA